MQQQQHCQVLLSITSMVAYGPLHRLISITRQLVRAIIRLLAIM